MRKKRKKSLNLTRILAVFAVFLAIIYFYLNIFSPRLIPKSLSIGVVRKPLNILILGTDITYSAETHKPMPELKGRADSILLAHINPARSQINFFSIPRDTIVSIPGYGTMKINAANVYGGIPLVKQTVTNFTQQPIDYYIEIKPTAITKMVDLLGGVIIDVEENMRYVDRAQNLKINLKKGRQKLSGKEAHDYIRYRNKFDGDIARIGRQQKFLKSISYALTKPSNFFKAPFAIYTAIQEVETDLPLSLTIRLLNLSRMLSVENIKSVMVPGDVAFIEKVGSVWQPDKLATEKAIEELF